ncbi:hypothetical protein RUND412_008553 [Rhizina undulata]
MSEWADYLTFDIMGELSFGKTFGMLEREEIRYMPDIINESTHRALICGTVTQLNTYKLDTWFINSIAEGQKRLMTFDGQQAQERMAMKVDRKDFFHYLISAKNSAGENSYSMEEMWAESSGLMIAATPPSKRPSAPDAMPRVVLPGGLQIGTEFFPAGVELGVSYYTLHRNPVYYYSPHEFNPSRWLKEAGEMTGDLSAFAPFSIGSRGCIGKRLAYIEIELVLARLVWGFDIKYISGGVDDRVSGRMSIC